MESRVALRVGLWLLIASGAAVALVMAARTEAGGRRAYAGLAEITTLSAIPLALRLPAAERPAAWTVETERLADNMRQLTADRDRLLARLEALERTETTGSIPSKPAAPRVPEAAEPEIPVPAIATSSSMPGEMTPQRSEFAVDLGATANLDAMRGVWSSLKAKHGGIFEGLRPLVAVRESPNRQGVALHLVAGPVGNATAAARLCVALTAMGERCEPAIFEGQRLALR